ncbi:MAG: PDZ domain-containing protein [Phycisphaeraceae bacterium]
MNRRIIISLFLLAALVPAASALAQRAPSFSPRLFKSGETTRSAFNDLVAAAREATVEILCDGKVKVLGAIIDADGFILTKASELEGKVSCKLLNGKVYDGNIIGVQHINDLAVIKIDAKSLHAIEWAEKAAPLPGQWLATVGRSREPVAVGVVSTPRRAIAKQPGALGIRRAEDDPAAKISEVYPNSAAADAGLKPGDVIVKVDDKEIKAFEQLANYVREHSPGDVLKLRVKRGEEEFEVNVELSPMSILPMMGDNRGAVQNTMGGKLSTRRFGFPDVIQHDTVLSPEQCGGPIVGLDGKALGINIARGGRVESYAIPADVILPLLDELKSGKLAPAKDIAKHIPVKTEPVKEAPVEEKKVEKEPTKQEAPEN